MTIEEVIESLEGINLEGVLPCEVRTSLSDYKGVCGQPSVARIRHACADCGRKAALFVCAECLEDLKMRMIQCLSCDGIDLHWTVI